MADRDGVLTAEDLYEIPDDDKHYELVNGRLRVSEPPGFSHGSLQLRLASRLLVFVDAARMGTVVTEVGFVLRRRPDTVRAPDVAFVRAGREPSADRAERYFEGAPDLAVEVVSPDDRAWEVAEKVDEYLTYGARLVWMVYPRARHVIVHAPDGVARVLRVGDALDGGDVIPGFRLTLAELFVDLTGTSPA